MISAAAEDVVVVIAAGNNGQDGHHYLDATVPQALGTANNDLITVGRVESDGSLWIPTTPERLGPLGAGRAGGSMTVYAQAKDVLTYSNKGVVELSTGTSFAAPAVVSIVLLVIDSC